MFVEKVKTEGLAHLSWVVGDGAEAVVIDPRRDIDGYLEIARQNNVKFTHILETHRNEDFISGAPLLARETGAKVLHGPYADEPILYAETINDGDEISVSDVKLRAIHTPGHTNDSMSYALVEGRRWRCSPAIRCLSAMLDAQIFTRMLRKKRPESYMTLCRESWSWVTRPCYTRLMAQAPCAVAVWPIGKFLPWAMKG